MKFEENKFCDSLKTGEDKKIKNHLFLEKIKVKVMQLEDKLND
jgi:hypothetical protein